MAKSLKQNRIERADLEEYLSKSSDFAFELRVHRQLNSKGLSCRHGGTYKDQNTGKDREFDIHALQSDGNYFLWLAVECKNVQERFPLLVCWTPRCALDSYHDLVLSLNVPENETATQKRIGTKVHRIEAEGRFYRMNAPVGKSCAQVGRRERDSVIEADDREVYEKWAQAVHSAIDLVAQAATLAKDNPGVTCSAVLPVLVVPDDVLWSVGPAVADGPGCGDRQYKKDPVETRLVRARDHLDRDRRRKRHIENTRIQGRDAAHA